MGLTPASKPIAIPSGTLATVAVRPATRSRRTVLPDGASRRAFSTTACSSSTPGIASTSGTKSELDSDSPLFGFASPSRFSSSGGFVIHDPYVTIRRRQNDVESGPGRRAHALDDPGIAAALDQLFSLLGLIVRLPLIPDAPSAGAHPGPPGAGIPAHVVAPPRAPVRARPSAGAPCRSSRPPLARPPRPHCSRRPPRPGAPPAPAAWSPPGTGRPARGATPRSP